MGVETICRVVWGDQAAEAKVLLESDEILLRAPFRAAIRFAAIRALSVEGDRLRLELDDGPASLELGAKAAARWEERIRNPKTRADKLGLKPGATAALVDLDDPGFAAELAALGIRIAPVAEATTILALVETAAQLARLPDLARAMRPDAALWAVRRKGKDAALSEAEVMRAGLHAGLTLTKTLRWSDTHTGEKFVVPVAARADWPKAQTETAAG